MVSWLKAIRLRFCGIFGQILAFSLDFADFCEFDNSLILFPYFVFFPVYGRGLGVTMAVPTIISRTKTEQKEHYTNPNKNRTILC